MPQRTPRAGAGILDLGTLWGPFSSTWLGISRILDADLGVMADCALYVARRDPPEVVLPDNIFGYVHNWSGDHRATVRAVPEDVRTDYSSFALRYLIDPRGDWALARFTLDSPNRARAEITFRNESDAPRQYLYGLALTLADARRKVRLKPPLRPGWIPARQYADISAYRKSFGLGCRQCLTRTFAWGVEDQVLAQAFGGWPGDRVLYRAPLPRPLADGHLYLRYVKYGLLTPPWELRVNGRALPFRFPQTWAIPGGGLGKSNDAYAEWRLLRVPVGALPAGELSLELRPLDPPGNDHAQFWLDGMLLHDGLLPGDDGAAELLPPQLIDAPLREDARVEPAPGAPAGEFRCILPGEPARRAFLDAEAVSAPVRTGSGSFLAHLRRRFDLPPARAERDAGVAPWATLESDPITVPPRATRTVRFSIEFDAAPGPARAPHRPAPPPHGPHAEMVARLRDCLLYNVNYPLRIFDGPSPFYVPAKHFPVPYSWDGGFIALGLATFAPERAFQQLAYYMTDAKHGVPFLYCASPVPTMLYALWDLHQATGDRAHLERAWDGARRMYDFYLGRSPDGICNAAGDGLLSTYAVYGNLGMDDHPIQRWAEQHHVTGQGLYSLILIAQVLRLARVMRVIAALLGHDAYAGQCRRDADLLAGVIDGRMWDEESGLYGWLCRTERGVERPLVGGSRGDRSACAFLPLFAGQMTHKDRLLPQLADPDRFLTPNGVSSMDMQSPLYNPDGYWNGGIWPVLQWYLWRGLLEAGEPALARRVAQAILDAWQRSYDTEHYLGEHFCIARNRMSGAPNFGGLSAALLPMHAAYFTPYAVTPLYDIAVTRREADPARDTLALTLCAPVPGAPVHDLLVNMGRPRAPYAVLVNGHPAAGGLSDDFGHLTLRLPRPDPQDAVLIRPG